MVRQAYLALILGVLVATVSSAFAPAPVYREPPKPKVPDVLALMQGTWEVDQNVNNGFRGGKRIRGVNQQIRIQGTTWMHINNFNGVETEGVKYVIALAPKALPAMLDLEHSNQIVFVPGTGQMVEQIAMKGIVKVKGDTLTFCYIHGYELNAERPKHFGEGNQQMPNGTTVMTMTMTMKKVK